MFRICLQFVIKLFREHRTAILYRRPFYEMMKEILADHRSARHRRLYAFDCVLFLYAHRALWLAYVMLNDFAPIRGDNMDRTLRNDILLGHAYTIRNPYAPIFLFLIYGFGVISWAYQTLLWRFDPNTDIWRWWYQLVVDIQDAYRAAKLPNEVIAERRRLLQLRHSGPSTRRRMCVPSVAERVYRPIVAGVRLWWTLSNVDQRRLFATAVRQPQSVSLKLSPRVRRWTIRILILADYVVYYLERLIVLLCLAFVFMMATKEIPIEYTTFARARIIVEMYALHYSMHRLLNLFILTIDWTLIGTYVLISHLIQINQSIVKLIRRFRRMRSNSIESFTRYESDARAMQRFNHSLPLLSYRKYGRLVTRQFVEHNKLGYIVLRINQDLFGSVMFAFMLTNLPMNIFLIRQICFSQSSPIELLAAYGIFFSQILTASAIIGLFARFCKIYHSPKRWIPSLQAITAKARWLQLKLKYDDLHGRLIRGPKIGLSVGPMEVVTHKLAFEFVLLYVAYLLMAFGKQIENDSRTI